MMIYQLSARPLVAYPGWTLSVVRACNAHGEIVKTPIFDEGHALVEFEIEEKHLSKLSMRLASLGIITETERL